MLRTCTNEYFGPVASFNGETDAASYANTLMRTAVPDGATLALLRPLELRDDALPIRPYELLLVAAAVVDLG